MNKKNLVRTLILGLTLSFSPNLFAQCPAGDIILASQAEVDNFVSNYGSCSILPGSLTIGDDIAPIEPSNINDISGLTSLVEVAGNLIIAENPLLTSLTGLDNLDEVGTSFIIKENNNLLDLDALSSVSTIGQDFRINENDALVSIDGLNDIDVQIILGVTGNNSLTNISGLNNINVQRGLVISENPMLTTITGLNNHNPGIGIGFMNNANLTDLSGFSVVGTAPLVLNGNTSLNICTADGLCALTAIPLGHSIDNNGTDCSTTVDIQDQCLAALPVSLISFEAEKNGNSVSLDWTTSQERNNAGFYIQYSRDAQNWINLTFINGQGNSDRLNDYNFIHNDVLGSKNYYRLKQIDFDGQYNFSEVKIVRFEFSSAQSQLAQVYPNPSNGKINLQFEPTKNSNSILKLSDSRGQIIWEDRLTPESNPSVFFHQLELPTNQLYFLFVQTGTETQVVKIQTIETN